MIYSTFVKVLDEDVSINDHDNESTQTNLCTYLHEELLNSQHWSSMVVDPKLFAKLMVYPYSATKRIKEFLVTNHSKVHLKTNCFFRYIKLMENLVKSIFKEIRNRTYVAEDKNDIDAKIILSNCIHTVV